MQAFLLSIVTFLAKRLPLEDILSAIVHTVASSQSVKEGEAALAEARAEAAEIVRQAHQAAAQVTTAAQADLARLQAAAKAVSELAPVVTREGAASLIAAAQAQLPALRATAE